MLRLGLFLLVLLFFFLPRRSGAEDWSLVSSTLNPSPPAKGLEFVTKIVRADREVTVQLVWFNTRRFSLKVIDQPDSNRVALETIAPTCNALAGVNASFFHPDYKPLGMVVTGGKILQSPQKAKLLSGVISVTKGKTQILRSSEFTLGPGVLEGIQAGPFLVQDQKKCIGLQNTRVARRTVVVTDGKETIGLVVINGLVTLQETAAILTAPGVISEFTVDRALNLDGGSSTALWVKTNPVFSIPEFGTVRNFLMVVPVP